MMQCILQTAKKSSHQESNRATQPTTLIRGGNHMHMRVRVLCSFFNPLHLERVCGVCNRRGNKTRPKAQRTLDLSMQAQKHEMKSTPRGSNDKVLADQEPKPTPGSFEYGEGNSSSSAQRLSRRRGRASCAQYKSFQTRRNRYSSTEQSINST